MKIRWRQRTRNPPPSMGITPQHGDLQVLTALPELDAGRQRQLGTGRILRSEIRRMPSRNIRSQS